MFCIGVAYSSSNVGCTAPPAAAPPAPLAYCFLYSFSMDLVKKGWRTKEEGRRKRRRRKDWRVRKERRSTVRGNGRRRIEREEGRQ